MPPPPTTGASQQGELGTRLTSWKEIAAHFDVTVRTVQRWERSEGLPVHRHGHHARATAYAFTEELDRWRESRSRPPGASSAGYPVQGPVARFRLGGRPSPDFSSVAVLPFVNVSKRPEDEYFVDGLTEELIHALSQLRGVRVVGRTSAFSYKSQPLSVSEIGSQLGVNTILEGSVRKSEGKVRITAQLVGTSDGFQLWSQRYEHDIEDIFAVQDDVANSIRDSLQATLSSGGQMMRSAVRTSDMAAYELYLKGRYYSNHWTPSRLREALACFEAALHLDPDFAPAMAGLARAHRTLGFWGTVPPEEAWPASRSAADRALAINPSLSEVQMSVGAMYAVQDRDWSKAEHHLRMAVDLNPGLSGAFESLVRYFLLPTGAVDEALTAATRAVELDPASPSPYHMLAWVQIHRQEGEAALESCARALHFYPGSPEALWAKAAALNFLGRFEEALDVVRQSAMPAPDHIVAAAGRANIYACQGDRQKAGQAYQDLLERSRHGWVSDAMLSWVPVRLGDYESAAQHLRKAIERRETLSLYLKTDPRYEPIRSQPQYPELLRMMKLEEAGPEPVV